MASNWPILSLLIWLPIFGGLAVIAAGDQRASLARLLALLFSGLTFVLSILLYTAFDTSTASMQFVELKPWIETFDIYYYLGVDGFSVPLILLTAFFGPLVVIAGWESIQTKVHQYMAAFLIMEGLMVGVFSALDGLLFYVFFEAMLIPMFLVIGMWGGPNRVYATIKFFLYTFLGSVFMLVGLIYLYIQSGSWSILDWQQFPLGMTAQTWLFLGFLAAFSVKVPMWPVHTWLPDAHVEAPTGGSVVLAAIMLKIGGYRAFQPAGHAGCIRGAGLADHQPVPDSGRVHRLRGPGSEGHEEADRVLVHFTHGLRHPGHVHRLCDFPEF